MEEMITYISSLGACGFIAYKLFDKLVKDSESDKQYYRDQIKENQKIYQEELKADRELYINSMNSVVEKMNSVDNKLEGLEQDISEIKEIIKK